MDGDSTPAFDYVISESDPTPHAASAAPAPCAASKPPMVGRRLGLHLVHLADEESGRVGGKAYHVT